MGKLGLSKYDTEKRGDVGEREGRDFFLSPVGMTKPHSHLGLANLTDLSSHIAVIHTHSRTHIYTYTCTQVVKNFKTI